METRHLLAALEEGQGRSSKGPDPNLEPDAQSSRVLGEDPEGYFK
jgi:hypothetical protein